jgi:phage shock protein PspC (stress-responsive transcriptional regulator)
MIAGVAGGVAEHLDADPSIIRIVWAVLIFLTGGLALLVYIVMAIVVPERPAGMDPLVATGEPGASAPGEPGAPATAEPVPVGSWRAPDGSTVPLASSTARRPRRRRDPADRARAGLIGGLILVGLGGIFLVREFIPAFDFDLWWPSLLIGLGIVLIVVAVMPSRRSN